MLRFAGPATVLPNPRKPTLAKIVSFAAEVAIRNLDSKRIAAKPSRANHFNPNSSLYFLVVENQQSQNRKNT